MRFSILATAAVCLACNPQGLLRLPPADGVYFPTGLVHVEEASSPDGYLYVASSNFDRRFDYGAVAAIELAAVGLPPFGEPVPAGGPLDLRDLHLGSQSQVLTQSFTGQMDKFLLPNGSTRLFLPSRAEDSYLYILDAHQGTITCSETGESPSAPSGAPVDCSTNRPSRSLITNERDSPTGKPRAPGPIGVGVSADGEVFVTHFRGADSPVGSAQDIEAYVVHFNAQVPNINNDSYISVGPGGTHGVAVGTRYAFTTGRFVSPRGYVLRLVDRLGTRPVLNSSIEDIFVVAEARGIALRDDEKRAYIVARGPDTLLVVDIQDPLGDYPVPTLIRAIPLPAGANEIKLIERAGQGPLAVVSCSTAGMIVLYDDDVGQLVAELPAVGIQPFALAVQAQGAGVRIFAGLFGEGRIAVLDLPDVAQPQDLRLVARLGSPQACLTTPENPNCAEPNP